MQSVQVFDFNDSMIRTLMVDGELLFRTADVAAVLGVQTHAITQRLPEEDHTLTVTPTAGGEQRIGYLRESGLYRAVLRSDKPEAEPFVRWVTREVLPAIRKTGGYGISRETEERMTRLEAAVGALAQSVSVISKKVAVNPNKPVQKKKGKLEIENAEDAYEWFKAIVISFLNKQEGKQSTFRIIKQRTPLNRERHEDVERLMRRMVTEEILQRTTRGKARIYSIFHPENAIIECEDGPEKVFRKYRRVVVDFLLKQMLYTATKREIQRNTLLRNVESNFIDNILEFMVKQGSLKNVSCGNTDAYMLVKGKHS